ncbi:MAG: RNA polymerase sigma factor [Bacteroidota bacterium]
MIVDNNAAWEQAYANYGNELEQFVRNRLDADAAADLLQETWAALARTLDTQTIAQPRAWLYRVARNRITDHYRRTAGQSAFQDLTPELPYPDDTTDYPDPDASWAEIEDALAELPAPQYEVFVRNELDGETLREIAADLGVPLKTIISRKGYARRRLQTLLRDLYEDYFGED